MTILKKIGKYLLILVGILLSIFLIYLIYLNYLPDINMFLKSNQKSGEEILNMIRRPNWKNSILLVGLIAIFNAIPGLSNSIFCIFSGLSYGPWLGLLINWIGNVLGNCLIAKIIRLFGSNESKEDSKILSYLMEKKNPYIGMTIGFMIPFVPSVLVNYNAMHMNINQKKYLTMVLIGTFPISLIYAFGGDAIFKGNLKKIVYSIIAIVVLFGISAIIYLIAKAHKDKKI